MSTGNETLHDCKGDTPISGYGPAINYCYEQDANTLWVGNYEYGSQVAFCPYCGFEAKVKPEIKN